jgi:hypothetical protein
MIANRHVEQRDREVRGKDRYPWLREEVSSPAAEVLPVRDCYEALIFKRKRGLPLRWIDHVRTILGLVYCMVHLASSPVAYSVPSQGVPQI